MFMHHKGKVGYLYPLKMIKILCIQWQWFRILLYSMTTVIIFCIQVTAIMIHLYLEVMTLTKNWYHMHIDSCLGTYHTLIIDECVLLVTCFVIMCIFGGFGELWIWWIWWIHDDMNVCLLQRCTWCWIIVGLLWIIYYWVLLIMWK